MGRPLGPDDPAPAPPRGRGAARPPRPEAPEPTRGRARRPHDAWQMDASERIGLAGGRQASWLRIVDEYTGAFLLTRVSPPGRWMDVPAREALAALRRAFVRRGRPGRIRVDNGYPRISTGELPTELGLWLLGLGVELAPNPPRRPQGNGAVEGAQNAGKRWADPPRCRSAAELQRNLDAMDRHRREGFPGAARSRTRLFPALAHSGRPYARSREAALGRVGRLRAALAGDAAVRRVNARGPVSVYNRNYYVGRRHAGRSAYVRLDAATGDWLLELADGPALGRYTAGLTREAIVGRRVTRRRGETRVASGCKR